MKSVLALALVGAVAAVPAWSDAPVDPVKVTTTTTVASTWADVPVKTTTTTKPVAIKTTTSDPWVDYVKPTTTTTKPVAITSAVTWSDYVPATVTTTVVNVITTYCPYATTFTDKGDVYTVTKATTLTLTKGPYTVTIPVYEETSTVCDTPVAPTAAASTWVDVAVPVAPTGKVTAVVPSAAPVKPSAVQPVSPYTGSASKMAGAGLAGVAAIAALLL